MWLNEEAESVEKRTRKGGVDVMHGGENGDEPKKKYDNLDI